MPVARTNPFQDLSPASRTSERGAVVRRTERFSAWVLSVLLHSLAISSALALANGLTIQPAKSSFRWDVSIIEASHPSPITSEQQTTTGPPPMSSTQPPGSRTYRPRHRSITPMPRPSAPLASRILTKSNVDATVLHDAEGSPDKPVVSNERITPAEMTGVTSPVKVQTWRVSRSGPPTPFLSRNRLSPSCRHQM
jgi:hypothetical protein